MILWYFCQALQCCALHLGNASIKLTAIEMMILEILNTQGWKQIDNIYGNGWQNRWWQQGIDTPPRYLCALRRASSQQTSGSQNHCDSVLGRLLEWDPSCWVWSRLVSFHWPEARLRDSLPWEKRGWEPTLQVGCIHFESLSQPLPHWVCNSIAKLR